MDQTSSTTDDTQAPQQDFMALAETQLREEQRRQLQQRATELQQARDKEIARREKLTQAETLKAELPVLLDPGPLEKLRLKMAKAIEEYAGESTAYNQRLTESRAKIEHLAQGGVSLPDLKMEGRGLRAGGQSFKPASIQGAVGQTAVDAIRKHQTRGFISLDSPLD